LGLKLMVSRKSALPFIADPLTDNMSGGARKKREVERSGCSAFGSGLDSIAVLMCRGLAWCR